MWQNNGFGGNGQFPNGFNNQENFPPSPFGAPPGQGLAGGQYFPTQRNMLQYEDSNGEGFMNNDFQPEVGLYNEGAFIQNQFINANPQVCVGKPTSFSQALQQRGIHCSCEVFQTFDILDTLQHLTDISVCASSPLRPSTSP
jgi:hypothetical protein